MNKQTQIKKFRIYAKKLFLTYSQVNPQITHIHVLQQLKAKFSFPTINYVIAKKKEKENHEDQGVHYHVILTHTHFEKFQITNPNQLDIHYENQVFHGNSTSVKNLNQTISYVCKDKNSITNFENLSDGYLLSPKEFMIKEVNEKGVEQALMDYYARTSNKATAGLSVSALKKHFNEIEKLKFTTL